MIAPGGIALLISCPGVTLRDVAERVGIHTTLMHYYFADKRALFEAVFARRSPVTISRRMDARSLREGSG
jgi:AcrR family transcriptional regulator